MTRDEYLSVSGLLKYTGRHEQRDYRVWRVLGPAGPVQEFNVHGIQAAADAIVGGYDYEVTNLATGIPVPTHILLQMGLKGVKQNA